MIFLLYFGIFGRFICNDLIVVIGLGVVERPVRVRSERASVETVPMCAPVTLAVDRWLVIIYVVLWYDCDRRGFLVHSTVGAVNFIEV